MRIAYLESDAAQATVPMNWLKAEGHSVASFDSGDAGVRNIAGEAYDMLILGTQTADMDGIDVLEQLHKRLPSAAPIMRIVASADEDGIVASLRAGADDCLVYPLRQAEFLARVEALGRRRVGTTVQQAEVIEMGTIRVDLRNRVIMRNEQRIPVTPKSYDLAVFLFNNLGQLLSRGYLMERIWGRGSGSNTRTLDTHISRLRHELGLTPENGWQLASIYQHGYRLDRVESGAH